MRLRQAIILTFLCVLSWEARAQLSVSAKLENPSIRIGEQTTLLLRAESAAGEKVEFPVFKDTLVTNVLILDMKSDTSYNKEDAGRRTIIRRYTLTSFDAATYTIPDIVIKAGTAQASTPAMVFEVKTVAVDTTKAFKDIKEPLNVSYGLLDWLRDNLLLVLGILAVIALTILLFRRLKKKKPAPIVRAAPDMPEDILALNKLEELKAKDLWQKSEFKAYYSELSDILREYLESRFSVKAMEKTTEELFYSMRNLPNPDSEEKRRLRELLELADLVKFAKERPLAEENIRSMDNAVLFIENTRRKLSIEPSENSKK